MRVLGIAGYSGSGKTTLIERLLPQLNAAGLRVAVIKHTHHPVEWDTPGKDSWRHREAGAAQVLLVTPQRRFSVETLHGQDAAEQLDQHLAALAPCDLVLAEGFKQAAIPKLELRNSAQLRPFLYPDDGTVLAVIADQPHGPAPVYFQRDDVPNIAAFVLHWMQNAELSQRN